MRTLLSVATAIVLAVALSACGGGSGSTVPSAPATTDTAPSQTGAQSILTVSDASRIVLPPRDVERNLDRISNLNYYGGPVMNVPDVYVVFWGWGSDPSGEQAYLTRFLNGIGGSAWLNTVTQYYSNTGGPITNPAGQLKGTWSDPSAVPRRPTDYQVAVEAYYATQHFGAAGPGNAIIVATPTGHSTRGFGTQWCAYHSYATTYTGLVINYTNLPYMTDAGQSCGMNAVNAGSAGLLDGVSIVAGHETAEAETDPEPSSGWLDASGNEIGDKCAWINMADTTLSTGSFAVQPLWSNAKSGCVLHTP